MAPSKYPILGAVMRYLNTMFGGFFRTVPTVVSVGTSVTQLVAFDSERTSLTIVNLSSNDVYVGPEEGVSATRGIRLAPSGGLLGVNVFQDTTLPMEGWWAVATGASSSVYVIAARRETEVTPLGS